MTHTLKCLFEQLPSDNIRELSALLKQHWLQHGVSDAIVAARLAVEDGAVADAARWRLPQQGHSIQGLLSLQLRDDRPLDTLIPPWPLIGAYSVESREITPPPAPENDTAEERTPGSLQVCLFRFRRDISRANAIDYWRDEHAVIACATQSTVGYRQHLITAKQTGNSTDFDGLVEEYFPSEASHSSVVFFNAQTAAQRQDHITQLTTSSSRFIAMDSLMVNHLSDYRLNITDTQQSLDLQLSTSKRKVTP